MDREKRLTQKGEKLHLIQAQHRWVQVEDVRLLGIHTMLEVAVVDSCASFMGWLHCVLNYFDIHR
jgi:hypothetical protein